ncbi:hypothetical protein Chor_001929 [Crotalus horridus]
MKLCLAAEGFGNRLCFLEPTSNAQKVPPDLAICCFILEQSLSVRALQEMLANTVEAGVEGRSETSSKATGLLRCLLARKSSMVHLVFLFFSLASQICRLTR